MMGGLCDMEKHAPLHLINDSEKCWLTLLPSGRHIVLMPIVSNLLPPVRFPNQDRWWKPK
jgi:hypothetical protein